MLFAEEPKVPVLASLLLADVPVKPLVILETENPDNAAGFKQLVKSYWVLEVLPIEPVVVAVVPHPLITDKAPKSDELSELFLSAQENKRIRNIKNRGSLLFFIRIS